MPRQNIILRYPSFMVGWVDRRERKKAMEQGDSIEVFKSGVISIDKSKEREQSCGPCKVDDLLVYRKAIEMPKVFTDLGCYHRGCPHC